MSVFTKENVGAFWMSKRLFQAKKVCSRQMSDASPSYLLSSPARQLGSWEGSQCWQFVNPPCIHLGGACVCYVCVCVCVCVSQSWSLIIMAPLHWNCVAFNSKTWIFFHWVLGRVCKRANGWAQRRAEREASNLQHANESAVRANRWATDFIFILPTAGFNCTWIVIRPSVQWGEIVWNQHFQFRDMSCSHELQGE